jgi:EAL domain-containing protein (putative c-di-GMP-specific phosphodiesterase class I)
LAAILLQTELFTGGRLQLPCGIGLFVMPQPTHSLHTTLPLKVIAMALWTQNLHQWWLSRRSNEALQVGTLLKQRSLGSVFQPMVELRSGVVYGHEAFVRAPRSMGELSYDNLLGAAKTQSCQNQLELACLDYAVEHWLVDRPKGLLFANISAETLEQLHTSTSVDTLLAVLRKHKVQPNRMGLDISGYTRISRLDVLVDALRPLRATGMQIALDDFKATNSSMQVWEKVQPHIVKMAPQWTRNIDTDPENARMVTRLVRLSKNHNSALLAKSVESESELRVMRELGVDLAQGYFLGSPSLDLVTTVNLRARAVLGVASR